MRKGQIKIKKRHLNILAIGLVFVFLIAGALLLLEVWETTKGRYPEASMDTGEVTYRGNTYVRQDSLETFLVIGLDKHEGDETENSGGQADFLMLFVFNNETKQCTAIHINRDTMANVDRLDVGGNKIDSEIKQIALAYNYTYADSAKKSSRNVADSVEDLLMGVSVQHYVVLTMDSVAVMNDLVGGVEVTVQDDFTGIDASLIKGETVTLQGEQALRYVRTRYGLEDSSNSTRMVRQRQYINALHEKVMSKIAEDETFLITLVDTMDEYAVYDSTDLRMKEFADKFNEYEFLGIREIEGELKRGVEYMEFYPDEDALQELVMDLFYEMKQ